MPVKALIPAIVLSVFVTAHSAVRAEEVPIDDPLDLRGDEARETPDEEVRASPSGEGRGTPAEEVAATASEEATAASSEEAESRLPEKRESAYRGLGDGEMEAAGPEERGRRRKSDEPPEPDRRLLHGFRLGYSFLVNGDAEHPDEPGTTVEESYGLETPHQFVVGYEAFYRLVGHDWLNVILVGNVSVSGLEQSTVLPSANGLIGFEFDESFQLGLGVNLVTDEHKPTHMVAAAGWTPQIGGFYVPVHFHFVPDIDKNHRMGTTIGINW